MYQVCSYLRTLFCSSGQLPLLEVIRHLFICAGSAIKVQMPEVESKGVRRKSFAQAKYTAYQEKVTRCYESLCFSQ